MIGFYIHMLILAISLYILKKNKRVVPCFSMNIGYFIRSDTSADGKKFELTKQYMADETINDLQVEVKECTYNPADGNGESVIECINQFKTQNIQLVFGFCDAVILNFSEEEIEKNNMMIWCTNTFTIGKCTKNFIMGNTVVNNIETFMFLISTKVEGVGFLGKSLTEGMDGFYAERIKRTAEYYGLTLMPVLYGDDVNETSVKEYVNTVCNSNLSVITFHTVQTIQLAKDVLDHFKDKEDPNIYRPIAYIDGGLISPNFANDFDSSYHQKNKGNFAFRGFEAFMKNNYTELYETKYESIGVPSKFEAVYLLGNLNMFLTALKKSESTNPIDAITLIYNTEFEYAGGKILLIENNYISATQYVMEFDDQNGVTVKYTMPPKKSFEPSQLFGEYKSQTCSLLRGDDESGMVDVTYFTIALIHHSDGILHYEDRLLTYFFLYLIDYYNENYNGILDVKIQPYFIEMKDDVEKTIDFIIDEFQEYNISTAFISCSTEERLKVVKGIENEINILLFYVGTVEGEECNQNGNPSAMSYASVATKYISGTLKATKALIFSSQYNYGITARKLLMEDLSSYGFEPDDILFYELISTDDEYLDHIINNMTLNIFNYTSTNGKTLVIITAEEMYQSPLIKKLYEYNITLSNSYSVISFNLNEILIKTIGSKYCEGIQFVTHYYDGYAESPEVLKSFSDYLFSEFNETMPLTNKIGIMNNLFHLLSQVVEISGSFNPEVYREYIYNRLPLEPSAGQYLVYGSGYAQGLMRIIQYSNGEYVSKMEDTFVRVSLVFSDRTMQCKWQSNSKGIYQNQHNYIIAALFNINTAIGVIRYDSLSVIADMINEDGGITGRLILIKPTLYDDNINNLITAVNRYIDNEDLLCFFGTSLEEERKLINPILEERDKLLFVLDNMGGEVAYRNIIFMNNLPHQQVEYALYWILYKFNDYIIVYSTTTAVLQRRLNTLRQIGEHIGRLPLLELEYDEADLAGMMNSIKTAIAGHPSCGIITIISKLPLFVNAYHNEGINVEKYPLFLYDYNFKSAYNEDYIGCYTIVQSYPGNPRVQANTDLIDKLNKYKGNAVALGNQLFFVIYNAMMILSKGMNSVNDVSTSSNIRNGMYAITVDGPDGKMKILTSNYVVSHMVINKINAGKVYTFEMELPFTMMAKPYFPYNNNNQYYIADFSLNNNNTKMEEKYIGIAFIMDTKTSGKKGLLDFILARAYLEDMNVDGGLQGRLFTSEIYQCPETSKDASSLFMELTNRGFDIVIGGCDPTHRKIYEPIIKRLESLFIYTGFDKGGSCERDIVYSSLTPSQEILPGLYNILYKESREFVLIYTEDDDYRSRVSLIKSALDSFGIELKFNGPVGNANTNSVMKSYMGVIRKEMSNGGVILALLHDSQSSILFEELYNYFTKSQDYHSSEEIAKDYTVYLFDNSNTQFNPLYSKGHYLYSSAVWDRSLDTRFVFSKYLDYVAPGDNYGIEDILMISTFRWLVVVLQHSTAFETYYYRKEMYLETVETVIGSLTLQADNHFLYSIKKGIINSEGKVEFVEEISSRWRSEAYRSIFNPNSYTLCDWNITANGNDNSDSEGGSVEVPTIKIGILLPKDHIYREDAVLFLTAFFSWVDKMNYENGGVKGFFVLLRVMDDGNDPEYAKEQIIDAYENYRCIVFVGGWTNDIRRMASKVADEYELLFFFPVDYEGEVCDYNCFTAGLSYSSFYTIVPYLLEQTLPLFLFYSDNEYNTYFAKHLIEDVEYFNKTFQLIAEVPITKTDISDLVKSIPNITPQGCFIVSLLEGDSKYNLLREMNKQGFHPPNFITMSLNMNYLTVNVLNSTELNGHSYWESFARNASNMVLQESVENYGSMFSYIKATNIFISRGFTVAQILENICDKSSSLSYAAFRKSLYEYSTDTALGTFSFSGNNNLQNVLMYKKFYMDAENNLQTEIAYTTKKPLINKPYGNIIRDEEIYRCNMKNEFIRTRYPVKKIGVIFSTTGYEAVAHKNGILGAITAIRYLYDFDAINGYVMLMELMNYDSDLEKLKEVLKKYDGDDRIVAYIGCTLIECRKIVQESAEKNNRLLYYPTISVGEECHKYTFYTSMVSNQYVTRLLEFILQSPFEKNYYILGENGTSSLTLNSIINTEASGLLSSKGEYIISDENPIAFERVKDISENISNGFIISTIESYDNMKIFLSYWNKLSIDSSRVGIIDVYLETEEFDNIENEERKNIYKIAKYPYDIKTDTNQDFLDTVEHYVGLKRPSSLFESTYSSVMLYAHAAGYAQSFDAEPVRKESYGQQVTVGYGKMTLDEANYVNSPFFIVQFSADGSDFVTVYSKYDVQSPQAWNWNIDSSYGYVCSFQEENSKYDNGNSNSDRNKNPSKFQIPIQRVAFISSLTGDRSGDNQGLVDIFQMEVNLLNDNGGVGGFELKADIFDVKSDVNECKTIVREYLETKNPLAVFGVINDDCIEAFDDIIESKNIIFFQLKYLDREICRLSYFVSTMYAEYYENVINVIRNRFYNNILYITPTSEASGLYIKDYLTSHAMAYDYYEYNTIDDYNIDIINEYLEYYNKNDTQNCIIFWGDREAFKKLMDLRKNKKYQISKNRIIVMANIEHIVLLDYTEYEYFGFYFENDQSAINQQFLERIRQRIDETTTPISDLMIRTLSSLRLWGLAINSLPKIITDSNGYNVVDVSPNNVRNVLRGFKLETVEGDVYFGNNQFLGRYPKLMYINSDKVVELDYSSNDIVIPEVFNSRNGRYKICDFSNPDIGDGEYVNTYTFAILLSITGEDGKYETPLFEALLAAMDETNENKLLDYYLDYKLFDTESSIDKYVEYSKKIIETENDIDWVFGGYSPEVLEKIGPIFDASNKGLIYIGRTYGDTCYGHVIQSHANPHQIADATIRKLLEISTEAYIVQSDDKYTQRVVDLIVAKMTNLIITSKGSTVYSEGNRVITNIQRSLGDGGTILTVLNDDQSLYNFYLNWCNDKTMRYPNFKVINVLFDPNVVTVFPAECMNGVMVIDSYFESMDDPSLNKLGVPFLSPTFNKKLHSRIGKDRIIKGECEASYSAFQIWKGNINRINSLEITQFAHYFHYFIDAPSDEVEVNVNNYVSRRLYCGQYNEEGKIEVNWGASSLVTPKIYDEYNNSQFGLTCDFSSDDKGANYNTNPIVLTFIHEKDLGGNTEKYNAMIIDTVIDDINSNGGILGKQLKANHTWLTINTAFRSIREIYEVGKSNTFLGCITAECSQEVSRYLVDKNSLFMFTGRDDGFTCNENMIVSGLSINQKARTLGAYLSTLDLKTVFLVGPERNSTYTEFYAIEKELKSSNVEIIGEKVFSPFYNVALDETIEELEKLLDSNDRIVIINLFIALENTKFLAGLVGSSKSSSFTSFFLHYDPNDLSNEIRKELSGSFVITGFSDAVSTSKSSSFKNLATSVYQNAVHLNEIIESSFSSIYLWKSAVEYASNNVNDNEWPSNKYIQLSYKYISYSSPSGEIKVANNNHVTRNTYVFRISPNGLAQVFPKQGISYAVTTNMTYLSDEDCHFTKIMETYKYNEGIKLAVIILSIIACSCCLFIAYVVFYFKKAKIIKSASPLFLYYTLLSLILLSIAGDMFILEPNDKVVCGLRVWFLAISLMFLFSVLFCKAWRIHKLFNNRELIKVKVSNIQLLKMIGIFLIVQIIYLSIWWIVDMSKPTLSFSDNYSTYLEDMYLKECSSNIVFVVLQLVGIVIVFSWGARTAWSVRKASYEFNESMPLLSTIIVMCIIYIYNYLFINNSLVIMGVILVPLDYLMDGEPDTLMALRGIGVEAGVFIVMLLQFGSKLTYIWLYELKTTWMSSSLSQSSTSKEKSQQLKKAAARGRFTVCPKILSRAPIEIGAISEQDRYFEDPELIQSIISRHSNPKM